jgi:hypothetical protein
MTEDEKTAAFNKAKRSQLRAGIRIQRDTAAEVQRLLKQAENDINTALANEPTDFKQFHLTALRQAVQKALRQFQPGATDALHSGADQSWAGGVALIDAPLSAAGIDLTGHLVSIDVRKLTAMKSFLTGRVTDITAQLANRINAELGATAIGTQTPFEAATKVSQIIEGGMGRAHTIVRTELGRAFSTAAQDRHEQAVQVVPGMKKQWRRSGKLHSRFSHDAIDGQIRDVDKPFDLEGGVKLMFPRDPNGPAKEIINCGCTSLPYMASWEVIRPGRQAFSDEEIAASRSKRDLASGF